MKSPLGYSRGDFVAFNESNNSTILCLTKNVCSIYNETRTKVLYGGFYMSGWTFFFILIGIVFLTFQFFRILDYIERPSNRIRRSAMR